MNLSDIIYPTPFADYVIKESNRTAPIFLSGIVERLPEIDLLAGQGGRIANMPYWNDLSGDDEVLNVTGGLTAAAVTAMQDTAAIHNRGKAWKIADVQALLSGDNPITELGNKAVNYWNRRMQTMLLASLDGIFAAASMAGNIYEGRGRPFSAKGLVAAAAKLGDMGNSLVGMIVHSNTFAKMQADDLVTTLRPSEADLGLPRYLGRQWIIVDDEITVTTGTGSAGVGKNDNTVTYLFGAGAFGFGEKLHENALEFSRDALAGTDNIISRRRFILHPRGVAFQGAVYSKDGGGSQDLPSPSNANLKEATNWVRKWDNKDVRIVAYKHDTADVDPVPAG